MYNWRVVQLEIALEMRELRKKILARETNDLDRQRARARLDQIEKELWSE